MAERKCGDCGKQTETKYLGKIRGKFLCKKCRSLIIKARREETINESGIKEELIELDKKIRREYQRNNYHKKKKIVQGVPKIKGSKPLKKKEKSNCYLPFHERQNLFRILIKRGLDADEVKERIESLNQEQKRIRKLMEQKDKSENEIKIKQQELLEELWNY